MQNNKIPVKTVKNGIRWTVREGYERVLNRLNPDDFRSNLNGTPYKLIKENKERSVISIPDTDINKNGIYVKYFKRNGYGDLFKYLFVPTRTMTEWKVGNALISKGINTAMPIAIAEKRTCSLSNSSLLVTEAVTDSEPLMEFCQANYEGIISGKKEAEKKELMHKLAGFIRDIHEKGFFHYDLHAGNMLIRFSGNKSHLVRDCSLYLMDLHRVRILKKISCRKRLYNLAQIFNSLSSILTKTDRLDFVRAYGSNIPGNVEDEHTLVRQIELQSSEIRDIHYRSRLKRCMTESSSFSIKRIAGMKMFFRKGYDTNSFLELIEKHDNALADYDKDAILKRDSRTTLTRSPFKDRKIQNVVVKQYKLNCGVCLIKNIFRNSAGRKAWIAGNGLLVYGFNTPEPLALMERKVLGITTGSYLIMEEIRGSLEMDRYILKNFNNKSSRDINRSQRKFIKDFARAVGKMHNLNIFHSDLKTCNIMVREKGKSFDFTFLDFDKISFGGEITTRKRVRNLTQINLSTPRLISTANRLRFLTEYLSACMPERQCAPDSDSMADRQSGKVEPGRQSNSMISEKKKIFREITRLSRAEKILYVSFNGDVTEDW